MIGLESRYLSSLVLLLMMTALPAWSAFIPPQNLDPASASIRLDSSFQSDAWLVYTYDIDAEGKVVNAVIQSSNGVLEVEQAVLQQVSAMRFTPAQRNGKPVKVSADPVIYTWILDKPRELSPEFSDMYQQAWAHYSEQDYDAAFEIAVQLKTFPGRNALEEVKFQVLAASLASRWKDESAELQHLNRVLEFQRLALNNNFNNVYVPADQYLKILNRILTLQLNRMMLADAGRTLESIQALGAGSDVARAAAASYQEAEMSFRSIDDVTVNGELVPLYRDGPGSWKTGLSRQHFSLSDVRGRVGAVFLVCANAEKKLRYPANDPWVIPPGWTQCLIDVTGKAGTSMVLHQYASGR
jgi:TonB family protein